MTIAQYYIFVHRSVRAGEGCCSRETIDKVRKKFVRHCIIENEVKCEKASR